MSSISLLDDNPFDIAIKSQFNFITSWTLLVLIPPIKQIGIFKIFEAFLTVEISKLIGFNFVVVL